MIGYVKSIGKTGQVIKSEEEVGGQPAIKMTKASKDKDGDGIPDEWEKKHKLKT